eukprot:3940659-Rhodomonas_salina.2
MLAPDGADLSHESLGRGSVVPVDFRPAWYYLSKLNLPKPSTNLPEFSHAHSAIFSLRLVPIYPESDGQLPTCVVLRAISLRACCTCYAMSGTEIANGAISLRLCSVLPTHVLGTELAHYTISLCTCFVLTKRMVLQVPMARRLRIAYDPRHHVARNSLPTVLRASYALSGTDLAYAPTRLSLPAASLVRALRCPALT